MTQTIVLTSGRFTWWCPNCRHESNEVHDSEHAAEVAAGLHRCPAADTIETAHGLVVLDWRGRPTDAYYAPIEVR